MLNLLAIFCAITFLPGTTGNDVVIGILGNSVSIDCKLPGADNLVWETPSKGIIAINGELLKGNRTKYVLEKYGGVKESLVIYNVTLTDETEYRCYDAHKIQRSFTTKLTVLVKPEHIQVSYPTTPLLEGTEATLVCEAGSGKPLPDITWYSQHSDGNVTELEGIQSHIMYANGTGRIASVLRINVTRETFMTSFICNVTVPVFYQESMKFTLDVHLIPQPPVIRGYNGSFDVNTDLTLECISYGSHPTATIFWQMNGSRAGDTEVVVIKETNNTSTVRSYLKRRMSRDLEGSVVTCSVSNSAMIAKGLLPISTNITLHTSYKPRLMIETQHYVAQEGENVTMECRIDALPLVDIHSVFWSRGDGTIVPSGSYELSLNASQFHLHLINITRADSGQYTCHATNRLGSAIALTKLAVSYAPRCITNQVHRVPVKIGSTVQLMCQMYAVPTSVTLSWMNLSNRDILTSITATQDMSTEELVYGTVVMKITSREQYTTIECKGRNERIGNDRPCLYSIEPPGPAEAPENCSVNSTSNKVTVLCAAGFDGGSAQTFILQTKVRDTFQAVSTNTEPEFRFRSTENTTVRVCAANEDFQTNVSCSQPLRIVINADENANEVIVAKEGNTQVYLLVGITGFTALLLVTAIVILLLRKRHKNSGKSQTLSPLEVVSQRRAQDRRFRRGEKWWNSYKPSEHAGCSDHRDTSPAMSRWPTMDTNMVCSTPYCADNKQPIFSVAGNSPILPEKPDGRGVANGDTPDTIRFDCLGESTGFIVSSVNCKVNDSDYLSVGYTDDNGTEATQNCSILYQTINEDDDKTSDESESVDMMAVTLDKEYSAGDIADVLDNTDLNRNNKTFDLDKPNSDIVINGTTLSFDADFSESDACGTHSNVYSSIVKVSNNLNSYYKDVDCISFESSLLSCPHDIGLEEMKVSDEPANINVFNTTYCLQHKRHNTLCDSYKTSDSEVDVTICPDVVQDITRTSIKCNDTSLKGKTSMYRNNLPESLHSNSSTDLSSGYFDETLCDIDQCILTLSNEWNKTELADTIEGCASKSNSFEENDPFVSCIDEPPTPVCGELRNSSFRFAIDNSTADTCDYASDFTGETLNDHNGDTLQHHMRAINETVVYF